ncbi:MAG: elongation factor Ts [Legionellales bacterium]|nr:elongation factor Ts [Legionellales bacterium]
MSITAQMVKELRERTGAGMMECKKALVESNGDIEAAITEMRKNGQAKAAKKSGRIAAEGMIVIQHDAAAKVAIIAEVNCETDFVARDENFVHFANHVAETALKHRCVDLEKLKQLTLAGSQNSVEQERAELVIKIGENINVRRLELFETQGEVGYYSHGSRIGVLIDVKGASQELAKDLAMHIAASNPLAVDEKGVDAAIIEKERDIAQTQAATSGKPADIVEKMVQGRVSKFLKENTLLGQAFIKNPDVTVQALLTTEKAQVVRFVRFEVGEGIEKVEVDFAKEVMAQARGE